MDSENKIIVYRGYVYEAGEKQLNEKELRYVYQELSGSLKHLNNVLNNVRDQNTKRAISSIERKIRLTFNDKIKNPDLYKSPSIEDMQQTANDVDQKMKQAQGISETPRSEDSTIEDKSSFAA